MPCQITFVSKASTEANVTLAMQNKAIRKKKNVCERMHLPQGPRKISLSKNFWWGLAVIAYQPSAVHTNARGTWRSVPDPLHLSISSLKTTLLDCHLHIIHMILFGQPSRASSRDSVSPPSQWNLLTKIDININACYIKDSTSSPQPTTQSNLKRNFLVVMSWLQSIQPLL